VTIRPGTRKGMGRKFFRRVQAKVRRNAMGDMSKKPNE